MVLFPFGSDNNSTYGLRLDTDSGMQFSCPSGMRVAGFKGSFWPAITYFMSQNVFYPTSIANMGVLCKTIGEDHSAG